VELPFDGQAFGPITRILNRESEIGLHDLRSLKYIGHPMSAPQSYRYADMLHMFHATGTSPKAIEEDKRPPRLLSGLTPEQTEQVLQSAEHSTRQANQTILSSGEPATNLFYLMGGSAKFYRLTKNGDEVLLWWLSTGDTFGLGSLLPQPLRYIGTAEAVQDCQLLVWSHHNIRALASDYQRLGENMLRIVLYYLASHADRLVGLATETAEVRLAHTLLQLSHRSGQVRPSGVELAIKNEDLSALANVSAFTASRFLKKWERQGLLQKTRGKINIVSPESLLID
jgi:CRP-like cAMP-binding protein